LKTGTLTCCLSLQMLWNMRGRGELMRGPAGSHMMPAGGMTNDFAPPTSAEAPAFMPAFLP